MELSWFWGGTVPSKPASIELSEIGRWSRENPTKVPSPPPPKGGREDRGGEFPKGSELARPGSMAVRFSNRKEIPEMSRIVEKASRIAQNRREPWRVSSEGSTRLRRSWGALEAFSAMLGASRDSKLTPASDRTDSTRRR